VRALVLVPQLLMASLSTVGDAAVCSLASSLFDRRTSIAALALSATAWFTTFTAHRTLSNTIGTHASFMIG
jgi:hypothetical protein